MTWNNILYFLCGSITVRVRRLPRSDDSLLSRTYYSERSGDLKISTLLGDYRLQTPALSHHIDYLDTTNTDPPSRKLSKKNSSLFLERITRYVTRELGT